MLLVSIASNQQTIIDPNENLNAIYYQYAFCLYQAAEFRAALNIINAGIAHIKAIDSHFMLADLFLLKAATLQPLGHPQAAQSAGKQAAILSEIFAVELYPIPNPD